MLPVNLYIIWRASTRFQEPRGRISERKEDTKNSDEEWNFLTGKVKILPTRQNQAAISKKTELDGENAQRALKMRRKQQNLPCFFFCRIQMKLNQEKAFLSPGVYSYR